MGPEKFQYVQRKSRTTKAKQSRKTSTQPLTTANAPGTRGGRIPGHFSAPAWPPRLPTADAHLGNPTSEPERLPCPSSVGPPSLTRAPPRPPAPAARRRAAGGRPAAAGIVRARAMLRADAARTARVARAAQLPESSRHSGSIFRPTHWSRESCVSPSGGQEWAVPPRSHAQSSPPAPRETAPGASRPGANPSGTFEAPCTVHGAERIRALPSAFWELRTEDRRDGVEATSTP